MERVAQSIDTLSAEWRAVGQKINSMLEAQDLEAVEAGQVPGNLTTVVARMDRRLAELKQVLAGVESLANDPQLREDILQTAGNARVVSEELSVSLATIKTRYVGLADELAQAVMQANTLLENANKPGGTVGKLVNDPALYNDLDDAAQRIGQVADELKLLIQKWKAEGVPVNF